MPETRALRGRQHSAESICLELPRQSSHQCDQSSTPSFGDGVFSDERSSVKMKLVDIWNSKLQTQGECTSTRVGESKEEFAPTKYFGFWDKMEELLSRDYKRYWNRESYESGYCTQCHFRHLAFCWRFIGS